MTTAAVVAYALLSAAIVAFHLTAWLATLNRPDTFWERVGWSLITVALGSTWTGGLVFASWRLVRSARSSAVAAAVLLVGTVLTPEVLIALVRIPYKGISVGEFMDVFLFPGALILGSGVLEHYVLAMAAAGVFGIQLTRTLGRARAVRSLV